MPFQSPIITQALLHRVIDSLPSRTHGIHGLPHWLRVELNGLELAAAEEGDPAVVSLFALFHDSRRLNDDARTKVFGENPGEVSRRRGRCR